MHFMHPAAAASMRGVQPPALTVLGLCPSSSNVSKSKASLACEADNITASRPSWSQNISFNLSECNAVSTRSTAALKPPSLAHPSAVAPFLDTIWIFAPFLISSCITSTLPCTLANISGVQPSTHPAFTSEPARISVSANSKLPLLAA